MNKNLQKQSKIVVILKFSVNNVKKVDNKTFFLCINQKNSKNLLKFAIYSKIRHPFKIMTEPSMCGT